MLCGTFVTLFARGTHISIRASGLGPESFLSLPLNISGFHKSLGFRGYQVLCRMRAPSALGILHLLFQAFIPALALPGINTSVSYSYKSNKTLS